jgi:pilus assembly protein Flp/PilA
MITPIAIRLFCCLAVHLRRDKSAVTALEYGLVAALIAVAIITAVKTLGTNLSGVFNTLSNHFANNAVN